jgi:3-deoxy-D-manno-octulosonate 8-phosphate phosphatase KdsC-like HAD superfamily phosphatase
MVPRKAELYISVPTVVHYCIKVLKVRYLYGGNDPKTICYTELGSELLLNDT